MEDSVPGAKDIQSTWLQQPLHSNGERQLNKYISDGYKCYRKDESGVREKGKLVLGEGNCFI